MEPYVPYRVGRTKGLEDIKEAEPARKSGNPPMKSRYLSLDDVDTLKEVNYARVNGLCHFFLKHFNFADYIFLLAFSLSRGV